VNSLTHLIAEAVSLAGEDLCAAGHAWVSIGGRHCPHDYTDGCSQPVFECARCGAVDYGEKGGPGHVSCATVCRDRWHAPERRYERREAPVIEFKRVTA
jgi:hypothetical protein